MVWLTGFWRRANSSGIPYSSRAPLSGYCVATGAGPSQLSPATANSSRKLREASRFAAASPHLFQCQPRLSMFDFSSPLVINIYAGPIFTSAIPFFFFSFFFFPSPPLSSSFSLPTENDEREEMISLSIFAGNFLHRRCVVSHR